jgi:hypothetical protein
VEKDGKLRIILGTLRIHMTIVSATLGSDVQPHAGYPITMDSRSAWPILPQSYTDPKAYIMIVLHELCGNNFQHFWGFRGSRTRCDHCVVGTAPHKTHHPLAWRWEGLGRSGKVLRERMQWCI